MARDGTNKHRDAVLERDDYKCANCRQTKERAELKAHHIVPLSLGGNNIPSNMTTLCGECHGKVHGKGDDAGRLGKLISEGIASQQENEDYHHGPAPLGFEKADGQLVEGDEYQRVVEVLDRVARGELSKRQAAKELDTSRRTVQRSIEERAELYGL
jgi:hypothetical protein